MSHNEIDSASICGEDDVNSLLSDDQCDTIESPSLPSLPKQHNASGKNVLTIKHIENRLNDLRRENFDLKLRLYLEKQNQGTLKSTEGEAIVAQELRRKEEQIKSLKSQLLDRDFRVKELQQELDQITHNQIDDIVNQDEFTSLTAENERLNKDINELSSLCKIFFSKLKEIRKFWRKYVDDKQLRNDHPALVNVIDSWFKNSREILNATSIEYAEELMQKSTIISSSNTESFNHERSSLGLLTDLSGLISENPLPRDSLAPVNRRATIRGRNDRSAQTLIDSKDMDSLVKNFKTPINSVTNSSQTECNVKNIQSQTEPKTNLEKERRMSIGIQTRVAVRQISAQTETSPAKIDRSTDIQTSLRSIRSTQSTPDRSKSIKESPLRSQLKLRSSLSRSLHSIIDISEKSDEKNQTFNVEKPPRITDISRSLYSIDKIPLDNLRSRSSLGHRPIIEEEIRRVSFARGGSDGQNSSPDLIRAHKKQSRTVLTDLSRRVSTCEAGRLSPDLGVGELEEHEQMRAVFTLHHYERLRCKLKNISLVAHLIENLNRDFFVFQVLDLDEFYRQLTMQFDDIKNGISYCEEICGNCVNFEDENALYAKFNNIKLKKEKMEKLITTQLKQAHRLLRRTKDNLNTAGSKF